MIKILLFTIVTLFTLCSSLELNVNRGGFKPYFIDNSSACTIYYYSASRVIKNCSNINLATNSSILAVNNHYVTQLYLVNNSFSLNLPYNLINTYELLHILDLSFNSLNDYTNDLQQIDCSLTCIKQFHLGYNSFSKFPTLHPTCTSVLQVLNLTNNKNIINIDQDFNSYKQMPYLSNLDLSYCSIEYLNMNNQTILSKFPTLAYLNLTGNRIKFIYSNPFVWSNSLMYLSFENNKIECSMSIYWIKSTF